MEQYKIDFINFLLKSEALKFGSFTLKSGRISPYFLNAGQFNTGEAIAKLGEFYAAMLVGKGLDFDVVFGPAYKGITCGWVQMRFLRNTKNIYMFNRKKQRSGEEV